MTSRGTDDASPSTRVVQRVAERESVDPIRLEPPLNDVVDPEALDTLFARTETGAYVQFVYCGYRVRVESDGTVRVEGTTGEAPSLWTEEPEE